MLKKRWYPVLKTTTTRKTWTEVVNDLHLKLNDAMDHRKWREVIRGDWRDSNIDSDAVR